MGFLCNEEEADDPASGEPVTDHAEGTPAAGGAGQATPTPALAGAYELRWTDGTHGRRLFPQTMLQQMPDCVWGRWLWNFGPTNELSIHNELLCEDSSLGTGMCRAEFQTVVRWAEKSFNVPAPIRVKSRFVNLRPQGGSWAASGGAHNSTTISCDVNLSEVNATLADIVPGQVPSRPQEVTLDIGNGERIRLVAAQTEVDYSQIMLRHALLQPGAALPPTIPPQAPVPAPVPPAVPAPLPVTPLPPQNPY